MKLKIVIPIFVVVLLAGCLELKPKVTAEVKAEVKPVTQAKVHGDDRPQSAKNHQKQSAGRDVKNVTVNVAGDVGDSVIYALSGVCGLLVIGWWVASRGRGNNKKAVTELVHSLEMFKSNLKRDKHPVGHTDWKVNESDYASHLYGQLKMACNYHQSRKTQKIVDKVRGKKRESKDKPEQADEGDADGEDEENSDAV